MTTPGTVSSLPDASPDHGLDNPDPVPFPGPYDGLLERLQGNILKGHGRNFTVNIFLRFNGDEAAPIRAELARIAGDYVMSAARQLREAEQRRTFGLPGALFGNLFLSRKAYDKLEVDADVLAAGFADPGSGGPALPTTTNFLTGMKGAAGELLDSIADPVEPLEIAYLDGHLHALLLLADDDEDHLLRTARREVDRIDRGGVATVVAVERGSVLRNAEGQGIEHFGYADGRSQPLFLQSDFAHLEDGKIVPGKTKERIADATGDLEYWNPFAPLQLVLLKDPLVADPLAYGSYYVFRKLEQDVRGFAEAERDLADALGLLDDDRVRAGAMVVGRFRDGTPLVLSGRPGVPASESNDFRYDGGDAQGGRPPGAPVDRFGSKCPLQAHIRKVSPRQHEFAPDMIGRRIVRRGITYGRRTSFDMSNHIQALPTGGVGLLFACFQRSIMRQFAFIQERWSNNFTFPIRGKNLNHVGVDGVIGQGDRNPHPWRPEYGGVIEEPKNPANVNVPKSHPTRFTFDSFVRFRGGEFFFAPSLPFLLGDQWAGPTST
jgi:deferrochelatase/peroxidase EfeB